MYVIEHSEIRNSEFVEGSGEQIVCTELLTPFSFQEN